MLYRYKYMTLAKLYNHRYYCSSDDISSFNFKFKKIHLDKPAKSTFCFINLFYCFSVRYLSIDSQQKVIF